MSQPAPRSTTHRNVVPAQNSGDGTDTFVTVRELLRREGRTDALLDETDGRVARRGRVRGAIAAGSFLAAGSVIGVAVLGGAPPTSSDARTVTDDGYPAGPGSGTDRASDARRGDRAPDPGLAPPTSWVPVAFADVRAGAAAPEPPIPGPRTTPPTTDTPAAVPPAPRPPAAVPPAAVPPAAVPPAAVPPAAVPPAASTPRTTDPGTARAAPAPASPGGAVGEVGDGLGDTVGSVAATLPAPSAEPARTLGDAVDDSAGTLGSVVDVVRPGGTGPSSTETDGAATDSAATGGTEMNADGSGSRGPGPLRTLLGESKRGIGG